MSAPAGQTAGGRASSFAGRKEAGVYIGIGTLVAILLIVIILIFIF